MDRKIIIMASAVLAVATVAIAVVALITSNDGPFGSEYKFTEGNLKYQSVNANMNSTEVTVCGPADGFSSGTIDIPGKIRHKGVDYIVVAVSSGSFMDKIEFTGTLKINEGVIQIEGSAFKGCTGLTGLSLPKSLMYLGGGKNSGGAFERCTGLTGDLVIPAGVSIIGMNCFNGCVGLTGTVDIPADAFIGDFSFSGCKGLIGLKAERVDIGDYAFNACINMTNVELKDPANIGGGAFRGCKMMTTFVVEKVSRTDSPEVNLYCFDFNSGESIPKSYTLSTNYDGTFVKHYTHSAATEIVVALF